MKRLNFFPIYESILRERRKTTTLRLGNRESLREGDLAELTIGWDTKDATLLHIVRIESVSRRRICELTDEDLAGESPDCSTVEAAAMVVGCVYRTVLRPEDEVTIVKFSHLPAVAK